MGAEWFVLSGFLCGLLAVAKAMASQAVSFVVRNEGQRHNLRPVGQNHARLFPPPPTGLGVFAWTAPQFRCASLGALFRRPVNGT